VGSFSKGRVQNGRAAGVSVQAGASSFPLFLLRLGGWEYTEPEAGIRNGNPGFLMTNRLIGPLLLAMSGLCACSSRPGQKPTPAKALPAARGQGIAAGAKKVNPKDGLTDLLIPPGTFTMGCSPEDLECEGGEKPAHEVTLTKGFWMGQTPVTKGAWKPYAQATGKAMPPEKILQWTVNAVDGNDSLPVVAVTWDEAAGYCGWAGMRLPSEAQWEYAARAGTTGARYGNLDEIAWYADNSGRLLIDSTAIWNTDAANYGQRLFDNGNGPKPVGQKLPNAYGLYDMLGNVAQWTTDWYDERYYQTSEKQDPSGPPGGTLRALRGGSWSFDPRLVRVSARLSDVPPGKRGINFGLRCVGE